MRMDPGQRLGADAARRLAAPGRCEVALPPDTVGLAGCVELHPPLAYAVMTNIKGLKTSRGAANNPAEGS
jgi:hypothetical protein